MSKYSTLWNYIKDCEKKVTILTFEEIGSISGVSMDHSFLRYKKELLEYGWKVSKISMKAREVVFEKC